jgi:myo-inositol-1(or 4)-monophosphatase
MSSLISGQKIEKQVSETCLFAIQIAREAGQLIKSYYGEKLEVSEKKEAGLVSNADKESEKLLLDQISKRFPSDLVLAEEGGGITLERYFELSRSPSPDSQIWLVDPLDGTTNFVRGLPLFCVSIARESAGRVTEAVIYQPLTEELFYAELGRGAFLNGKKVQVSHTSELDHCFFATGFTHEDKRSLGSGELETFFEIAQRVRSIRRLGSAALDLAYVACGRFDGFWQKGLSPWDTAAGSLMVREAGGCVFDFEENEHHPSSPSLWASNARISQKIQRYL